MAFYGLNFIFDGVPSENYGLQIVNFDNGMVNNTFGVQIEEVQDMVSKRHSPYHYGIKYDNMLTFTMKVARQEAFDAFDKQAIGQWLFGHQQYKWLQVVQDDLEDIWFKCILKNPQTIDIANNTYGFTFEVVCDAPWAWTDEYNYNYRINGSQNISFENISDDNNYLYPIITYATTDTNFSIINKTDSSRLFAFSSLDLGENLVINNNFQTIETDSSEKRINNFNLKWFRLLPGQNELTVLGTGSMLLTMRFPKKVGA